MINRKIFLLMSLIALSCIAGPQKIIQDFLQKLENNISYQSYGATPVMEHDEKDLQILLRKDRNEIGKIKIELNGYKYAKTLIEEFRQFGEALLNFNGVSPERIDQTAQYFGELEKDINEDNIAYFSWIGIEYAHQGKKLSYPLMCATFGILKYAFNKKYVFLYDNSGIDNYYTKMAFFDTKFKKIKFEEIDTVLKSNKCKIPGLEQPKLLAEQISSPITQWSSNILSLILDSFPSG